VVVSTLVLGIATTLIYLDLKKQSGKAPSAPDEVVE
jgi:hypothetical protein